MNNSKQDEHSDAMCCFICLNDYEHGDQTMTGKQCSHLFHADCFLLCAVKRNHCPYRGEELMTAQEFRVAALEVLGKESVGEISNIESGRNDRARHSCWH